MVERTRVTASGDLDLGRGIVIASREVRIRATTPGGPGGQHANRTLSKVVASLDVAHCDSLPETERALVIERLGAHVSASSSSSRSQAENRRAALERLARRVAGALDVEPPRKSTRPTRAAVRRRIDEKRRRSALKQQRHLRDED